jgi:hypothetical protein
LAKETDLTIFRWEVLRNERCEKFEKKIFFRNLRGERVFKIGE